MHLLVFAEYSSRVILNKWEIWDTHLLNSVHDGQSGFCVLVEEVTDVAAFSTVEGHLWQISGQKPNHDFGGEETARDQCACRKLAEPQLGPLILPTAESPSRVSKSAQSAPRPGVSKGNQINT